MRKIFILVLAALLLAGALGACTPGRQAVEGAELDAVLEYSEPAADRVFEGLNSNDYAVFSADFAEAMGKSIGEAGLNDMQTSILGKTGKYVSRTVARVEQDDQYVAVIYDAKFEQEDHVTVRLVFDKNEAHTISGIWFDSPKLREK